VALRLVSNFTLESRCPHSFERLLVWWLWAIYCANLFSPLKSRLLQVSCPWFLSIVKNFIPHWASVAQDLHHLKSFGYFHESWSDFQQIVYSWVEFFWWHFLAVTLKGHLTAMIVWLTKNCVISFFCLATLCGLVNDLYCRKKKIKWSRHLS